MKFRFTRPLLWSHFWFLLVTFFCVFRVILRIPMITKPMSQLSRLLWDKNCFKIPRNVPIITKPVSHKCTLVVCYYFSFSLPLSGVLYRGHTFSSSDFFFRSILQLYFSINISQGKTQSNVHTTLYSTIYKRLGDFRGFDNW
jgi:hypothetical protein